MSCIESALVVCELTLLNFLSKLPPHKVEILITVTNSAHFFPRHKKILTISGIIINKPISKKSIYFLHIFDSLNANC